MRFQNIERTIQVEIPDRQPHAGLLHPVEIQGQSSLDPILGERAVAIVVEEQGGRRIAGEIDVLPAVAIEIGCDRREAERRSRFRDAGFHRYIFERAVASVAIEEVTARTQPARTAWRGNALP